MRIRLQFAAFAVALYVFTQTLIFVLALVFGPAAAAVFGSDTAQAAVLITALAAYAASSWAIARRVRERRGGALLAWFFCALGVASATAMRVGLIATGGSLSAAEIVESALIGAASGLGAAAVGTMFAFFRG